MKKFVIKQYSCIINPFKKLRPWPEKPFPKGLLGLLLLLWLMPVRWAFSEEQTLKLVNGWNAVFFHVTPEENDCDKLFENMPEITMAYAYENAFSSMQYLEDENVTFNNDPKWLIWRRENKDLGLSNGLSRIIGGGAYILKVVLPQGAADKEWTVNGASALKTQEWRADQFNLSGFQFGEQPPTYRDFFSESQAHFNQPIYVMNSSSGSWERLWCWEGTNMVTAHKNRPMQNGEAFWIFTKGYSDFQGPLKVEFDQISGLNFETDISTLSIKISNSSASAERKVTLTLKDLTVPLYYKTVETDEKGQIRKVVWKNLLTEGYLKTLKAGEREEVTLAVDRKTITGSPDAEGYYFSQLNIREGNEGSLKCIPVKVKGFSETYSGLWVGSVSIDKVSRVKKHSGSDPPVFTDAELEAVSSPFQFRLIVHVDKGGKAKLLKEVTQMLDADKTPAEAVLLDSSSKNGNYTGVAIRDGVAVGRRISSSVFAKDSEGLPKGGFGKGIIDFVNSTPFNDPVNPFYHKYHPDHDNLDERFDSVAPEAFSIKRNISMDFSQPAGTENFYPGQGESLFQGGYSEVIQFNESKGLCVKVSGEFELSRVSDIETIVPAN